ncbi:unnamed protein product [Zymoseptoria tritici ST99CH_1E4]|uniref:BTB domain-containing protein n=1 Tax=Zymoseptoria tritici ST99CH_1E4 TaxID=1276532 RepID=A0A2H1H3J5_ZYMTR|nr:unnamed protein product [Zymoseptoria tritici ST99CH_1E4]
MRQNGGKDELVKKLESPSQRFIEIKIGQDSSPPIYIAQQTLESLSPYFCNALKDNTFTEGKNGSMSFPEDEPDVWKELAHWIYYHRVSN